MPHMLEVRFVNEDGPHRLPQLCKATAHLGAQACIELLVRPHCKD